MEYDVSKLDGALLDAAVALAEGIQHDTNGLPRAVFVHAGSDSMIYNPSENWSLAGPIIHRERITTSYDDQGGRERGMWNAYAHNCEVMCQDFNSPLVATMRAYVASKLGEKIELP